MTTDTRDPALLARTKQGEDGASPLISVLGGRSRVAQREACMKDILRHRWPTTRASTTLVRCTHNFAVAAGVRLCGLAWSCGAAHAKP